MENNSFDKMRLAVSDQTRQMTTSLTDMKDRLEDSNSSNGMAINYDELAEAIWKIAPDMNTYLDGKRVSRELEPYISETQARKTRDQIRRGNTDA